MGYSNNYWEGGLYVFFLVVVVFSLLHRGHGHSEAVLIDLPRTGRGLEAFIALTSLTRHKASKICFHWPRSSTEAQARVPCSLPDLCSGSFLDLQTGLAKLMLPCNCLMITRFLVVPVVVTGSPCSPRSGMVRLQLFWAGTCGSHLTVCCGAAPLLMFPDRKVSL